MKDIDWSVLVEKNVNQMKEHQTQNLDFNLF